MTKADGKKQLFDRQKVVKTCLRMGVNEEVAEVIAEKIGKNIYNGIETRKILQMIFRHLNKYKPAVRYQIDLRKALSMMKSAPDFERFIRILLREHGYEVVPNQIVRGKCVEHEVDAVATKNGETYIVEVKHHSNYHTPTGLDAARIARAVFEDVTEGFKLRLNNLKIDKAMIVCNTKLSQHAEHYVECRGIRHIGWSSPSNRDLQTMIEEKKLYPVHYLKGLNIKTREKLTSAGIILLKQLTTKSPKELRRKTGIRKETLELIVKKARKILSENE
ncbi:MAG: restriction endonuclease [Candidatus Bathyarchaeota archaeon]|nr:MAG: restriction endonuclease [Candidatus Bathyarchaeota archaeon]